MMNFRVFEIVDFFLIIAVFVLMSRINFNWSKISKKIENEENKEKESKDLLATAVANFFPKVIGFNKIRINLNDNWNISFKRIKINLLYYIMTIKSNFSIFYEKTFRDYS